MSLHFYNLTVVFDATVSARRQRIFLVSALLSEYLKAGDVKVLALCRLQEFFWGQHPSHSSFKPMDMVGVSEVSLGRPIIDCDGIKIWEMPDE